MPRIFIAFCAEYAAVGTFTSRDDPCILRVSGSFCCTVNGEQLKLWVYNHRRTRQSRFYDPGTRPSCSFQELTPVVLRTDSAWYPASIACRLRLTVHLHALGQITQFPLQQRIALFFSWRYRRSAS